MNLMRFVAFVCSLAYLAAFAPGAEVGLSMPQLVNPVQLPSQHGISLYALTPTRMVRPNEDPAAWKNLESADHIELAGARNESEQFLLVIRPVHPVSQMELRFVSDSTDLPASNWSYQQALTVDVKQRSLWYGVAGELTGAIFDPLVNVTTFDAPAGPNSLLLIQVRIPGSAASGIHTGHLEILAAGQVVARVPYRVDIWNLTMAPTRALQTMVSGGLGEGRASWQRLYDEKVQWLKYGAAGVQISYDKNSGQLQLNTDEYARKLQVLLSEIGISKVALPPSLLGSGGSISQNYLSTGVAVGSEAFWPIYDQYMRQMGDFYREHGWESRVVFYIMDEINEKYYPLIEKLSQRAKQQFPELEILLPTNAMPNEMARSMDIWVVPWHFFVTQPEDVKRWDQLRSQGMHLWAYMNSLYTLNASWTLSAMRFYPTVLAKYGYTGNLWWSVTYFGKNGHPWDGGIATLRNEKRKQRHYGNGYLFYPPRHEGDPWSSSLRWESYEQGLDEYELLHMLHQRWSAVAKSFGSLGRNEAFSADRAVRWWGSMLADGFRLQTYRRDGGYIQRFRQLVEHETEILPDQPLILLDCLPAKGTLTTENTCYLRGICHKNAQITIDGKEIPLQGIDGNTRFFEYNRPLRPRRNLIVIEAKDDKGHHKTLYREVSYQPEN